MQSQSNSTLPAQSSQIAPCFDHGQQPDLMCQECRGKGIYAGLDVACRGCNGSGMERQSTQLAAYREKHVTNLAICVAAESEASPETVLWRDVFCRECDEIECLNGTARQLAEKVFDLNWHVEDVTRFNVICPQCADC